MQQSGAVGTLEYKLYSSDSTSWFHDIPLWADKEAGVVNFVAEIPRGTQEKMEIATKLPMNPIIQDTKKGKLRIVRGLAPFNAYTYNYGALPQTCVCATGVEMR